MRKPLLTTLTLGALAFLASPALAGDVTFEGLTALNAGDALGSSSVSGIAFSELYLDRDDGPADSGSFHGFSQYFTASGNTAVASNFSLGISTDVLGDTRYDSIAGATVYDGPSFSFTGGPVTTVSFDFIANFGTSVLVELVNGTTTVGSGTFTPTFAAGMPIVQQASLTNGAGFDSVQLTISGASANYFAMDNVHYGIAVVPLPPAAFMGLGLLAGLGLLRRMRRSAAI